MTETFDFERSWQTKLAGGVEAVGGSVARDAVVAGGSALSDASPREAVIRWTQGAIERLEGWCDAAHCVEVMTGCSCHYPKEALQDVRAAYAARGDIDEAMAMLQAKFVAFLRDDLELDEAAITELDAKGWGLAGVREGKRIIATKIPKSGVLKAYLAEPDPDRRRALYCHCPRVRDAAKTGECLPLSYCFCGAGFYQGIWEEILQKPVEVDMLESVLSGGDACRVAIEWAGT